MLAMIRTVLFLFFSVTLWGKSSVSLKVIEQARSQLKTMGKLDPIALSSGGLTFVDSAEDVEDLMKVLISRKEDSQIKKLVADAMSKFRSKDSLEAMSHLAKMDRNYNEFTFPLLLSQGVVPEDDILWSNLIKARDQSIAQLAIKELGGSLVRSPKIADALIQRLKNPQDSPSFKNYLIKKFTEVPTNKAAVSLAWLLGNGKYKNAAHETLTKTTGQSLAADVRKWQNWLRKNKNFTPIVSTPKDYPTRKVTESNKQSSSEYPDRYSENGMPVKIKDEVMSITTTPKDKSIYGIEIEGKTILFFLDCSGSMRGAPFEVLKEQILYMAKTMDNTHSIGVVFFPFSEKVSVFEVSKNTAPFRSKLKRFLSQKNVGGPSPLLGAMNFAYNELIDDRYNPVETIYIISDGHIGSPEARSLIYELNGDKRIPIHTICIRGSTHFLNGVASDNQGRSFLVQ
jgi:hypothetical protein